MAPPPNLNCCCLRCFKIILELFQSCERATKNPALWRLFPQHFVEKKNKQNKQIRSSKCCCIIVHYHNSLPGFVLDIPCLSTGWCMWHKWLLLLGQFRILLIYGLLFYNVSFILWNVLECWWLCYCKMGMWNKCDEIAATSIAIF